MGRDDGDYPEGGPRVPRSGPRSRPGVFQQRPGRDHRVVGGRGGRPGPGDRQLQGPDSPARDQADRVVLVPVPRFERRCPLQAHLGDGLGRRRPRSAPLGAVSTAQAGDRTGPRPGPTPRRPPRPLPGSKPRSRPRPGTGLSPRVSARRAAVESALRERPAPWSRSRTQPPGRLVPAAPRPRARLRAGAELGLRPQPRQRQPARGLLQRRPRSWRPSLELRSQPRWRWARTRPQLRLPDQPGRTRQPRRWRWSSRLRPPAGLPLEREPRRPGRLRAELELGVRTHPRIRDESGTGSSSGRSTQPRELRPPPGRAGQPRPRPRAEPGLWPQPGEV